MLPPDDTGTTAAVQQYLGALAGAHVDSPADPIIRTLLARAVGRLPMLCTTLLHQSHTRRMKPISADPSRQSLMLPCDDPRPFLAVQMTVAAGTHVRKSAATTISWSGLARRHRYSVARVGWLDRCLRAVGPNLLRSGRTAAGKATPSRLEAEVEPVLASPGTAYGPPLPDIWMGRGGRRRGSGQRVPVRVDENQRLSDGLTVFCN